MNITLKLFAGLGQHLPAGAQRNQIRIQVPDGATPEDVVRLYDVPLGLAHLVLINGVFVPRAERGSRRLQDDDELAVFPPVAGG